MYVRARHSPAVLLRVTCQGMMSCTITSRMPQIHIIMAYVEMYHINYVLLLQGFATNILGPTLTNMRVFLNTNTEQIVSAFSGSIVGWIGGSVIAGIIYERFNPELQLTLSCLTMCLATGLAPWSGSLVAFVALMTIQGLGAGFIDAGECKKQTNKPGAASTLVVGYKVLNKGHCLMTVCFT